MSFFLFFCHLNIADGCDQTHLWQPVDPPDTVSVGESEETEEKVRTLQSFINPTTLSQV